MGDFAPHSLSSQKEEIAFPKPRKVVHSVGLSLAKEGFSQPNLHASLQNRYGTLHGGCIATMVDVFTTAALWTVGGPPGGVSVDLSIAYMAAARAQVSFLLWP